MFNGGRSEGGSGWLFNGGRSEGARVGCSMEGRLRVEVAGCSTEGGLRVHIHTSEKLLRVSVGWTDPLNCNWPRQPMACSHVLGVKSIRKE